MAEDNKDIDTAGLESRIVDLLEKRLKTLQTDLENYVVDIADAAIGTASVASNDGSDDYDDDGDDSPLPQQSNEVSALRQQIKALEEKDAERERNLFNAKFDGYLSEVSAKQRVTAPSVFKAFVKSQIGDKVVTESGKFYVKEPTGTKTLDTYLQDFFNTDDGKFFIPQSGVSGSGSVEDSDTSQVTSGDKTDPYAYLAKRHYGV